VHAAAIPADYGADVFHEKRANIQRGALLLEPVRNGVMPDESVCADLNPVLLRERKERVGSFEVEGCSRWAECNPLELVFRDQDSVLVRDELLHGRIGYERTNRDSGACDQVSSGSMSLEGIGAAERDRFRG
jgi:hypothetical protein